MMMRRDDPKFSDPSAIVADLIDLMHELADELDDDVRAGKFNRHGPLLAKVDKLVERLNTVMPAPVLDQYREQAERAIARLRQQFAFTDVQGRA